MDLPAQNLISNSFVHENSGYLSNYTQDVNGETLSGDTNYYSYCAKLFGQPTVIACTS